MSNLKCNNDGTNSYSRFKKNKLKLGTKIIIIIIVRTSFGLDPKQD